MLETIFKNQVLMSFIIACIWTIPGIVFISATKHKYDNRQKEERLKKISKLYPHS